MLSKTIRNAATSGKYNEFDLETWAHEAKGLEEDLLLAEYRQEEQFKKAAKYYAENAELRKKLEDYRASMKKTVRYFEKSQSFRD